jgi:hypothetical protein
VDLPDGEYDAAVHMTDAGEWGARVATLGIYRREG